MPERPVRDITPREFLSCAIGACPAVFETEEGTYLIVGRLLPKGAVSPDRIGPDEVAIEIPAELLSNIAAHNGASSCVANSARGSCDEDV